jgi:hypothetical protein
VTIAAGTRSFRPLPEKIPGSPRGDYAGDVHAHLDSGGQTMRQVFLFAALAALLVPAGSLSAQAIIAQNSGLVNPDHVIDFGANLFPNFTPISNQFPGITVYHARYFTTGVSTNLVGGFLTNDFSGLPNTLRIVFASPIHDLSFVYHQISTVQPSNFRAVLNNVIVDSFSNTSNQTQLNNYFGFTNVVFDELQLDFVSDFNVDTLAYNDVHASCSLRNGNNINALGYACVTLPVLGTNLQLGIATTPNTVNTVLAIGAGPATIPFGSGEILLQLNPFPVLIEGPGSFTIFIPNDPTLLGLTAWTQGVRVDLVGPTSNVVLLNALDLVVGT